MMNKTWVLPIMFVLALGSVLAACVTTTTSSGTDYLGVTTTSTNETAMTSDQIFVGYTYFTPRLNFTRAVNETFTGGVNGSVYTITWRTLNDYSTSLVLYNKSNYSVIPASNYTYTFLANGSSNITWKTNFYNGSTIVVEFNRTFVKNVDDLVVAPQLIKTGAVVDDFLGFGGGTDYGVSKTFFFNSGVLGNYLKVSNWAVGWDYGQRVCTGTDVSTTAGINNTKTLAYAGFALLAVMILVTVAWGLISLFKGGNVDFMAIAIAAIGGGVILLIAFIVIYYVALGLGI